MSSESPSFEEPLGGFKRRRLQNACDLCRRKKTRCDSARMPGNICSKCKAFNSECTHFMSASRKKKKGHVPPDASSRSSEDGHHQMNLGTGTEFAQNQINAILSIKTPYTMPTDPALLLTILTQISIYARHLEQQLVEAEADADADFDPPRSPPSRASRASFSPHPQSVPPKPVQSNSTQQDVLDIEPLIDKLKLLRPGENEHFFGKSSQVALLKTVMQLKTEQDPDSALDTPKRGKRSEFWDVYPWQRLGPEIKLQKLQFPDRDLLEDLVDLYFRKRNIFMPLLHRPTFERAVQQNLHERDRVFGELLLSVCALGSRYSNDPRAFADASQSEQSLGWSYFSQITIMQEANPENCLYRVQTLCNAVIFLQSTSTPATCWTLLGIGVRAVQVVGAHRKSFMGGKPSVQQELWKRAFWVLVSLDAFISSILGRPKATNPAEYDLELPTICDDEYWEHPDPEQAFKQPPGKPSWMHYWVKLLKLLCIFEFAQRSIYAVRQPELWAAVWDSSCDEKVVVELDQALNKWVDSIPSFLKWDPSMEDEVYFNQSSSLYAVYYWVQIQIHRPFIVPNTIQPSGMLYSSLAVCTNAARGCAHVLDVNAKRGHVAYSGTYVALFNSAIVMLLNLWAGKRLGLWVDPAKEMADVYKCVNVLHMYETRWQSAGRMCDILLELISVQSLIRAPDDANDAGLEAPVPSPEMHPNTLSVTNTSTAVLSGQHAAVHSLSEPHYVSELPMHTEDLGRLPDNFSGIKPVQISAYSTLAPHAHYQYHTSVPSDRGSHNTPYKLHSGTHVQAQSALAMWNTTPDGHQWEDWGSYMASVDDFLRSSNISS